MAAVHLYSVVGDGNVRRNMTTMNSASRASMTSARIIDCTALNSLQQALAGVTNDTTVVIIQSLTSFLVDCNDTGSVYGTVDPVLTEFAGLVRDFCSSRSAVQVVVAPPLYRPMPAWYRHHMPEIACQFSKVLSRDQPRNLHLMVSPAFQDLCPDGVHLTPVSGLHYVLHLFDEAQRLVEAIGARGDFLSCDYSNSIVCFLFIVSRFC